MPDTNEAELPANKRPMPRSEEEALELQLDADRELIHEVKATLQRLSEGDYSPAVGVLWQMFGRCSYLLDQKANDNYLRTHQPGARWTMQRLNESMI